MNIFWPESIGLICSVEPQRACWLPPPPPHSRFWLKAAGGQDRSQPNRGGVGGSPSRGRHFNLHWGEVVWMVLSHGGTSCSPSCQQPSPAVAQHNLCLLCWHALTPCLTLLPVRVQTRPPVNPQLLIVLEMKQTHSQTPLYCDAIIRRSVWISLRFAFIVLNYIRNWLFQ